MTVSSTLDPSSDTTDQNDPQLTDSMASLALTTSGLPPPTGVSTNIQTEFLRPAGKEGGEFVIEAEVVKLGTSSRLASQAPNLTDAYVLSVVGKLLATTRINFYDSDNVSTRKLLAFGSHTKAVNKAWEACGGVRIIYLDTIAKLLLKLMSDLHPFRKW